MFIGHVAVGLAGRRIAPDVSLGVWVLAVLLVDLIWPLLLLLGIERVRVAPGITAFTPLDFSYYPWTHSLVAGVGWALLLAAIWHGRRARPRAAWLLAGGVLSHWALDVVAHRPDVPVLPDGPYLGLGLWYSVAATLAVELSMFAAGLWIFLRARPAATGRASFWALIGILLVTYFGAAFGPPPPDARTVALSALGLWLLVALAAWADRSPAGRTTRRS